MSVVPRFPVAEHVTSESVMVALFLPSITAICAPLACPLVLSIEISPVEYITGEPATLVVRLEFFTLTVPSHLSVASVAHDPPFVFIVTLSASIYPPYVASRPLAELSPVVFIVVSLT